MNHYVLSYIYYHNILLLSLESIYGENYIIPNEDTSTYTEEEKQHFDNYKPRSSVGFEYEVYIDGKSDSFHSSDSFSKERAKSSKLKSSLKVKTIRDSLNNTKKNNDNTITLNPFEISSTTHNDSYNSSCVSSTSSISKITDRSSVSGHRVSFSQEVDELEIENEKKRLLAKRSRKCCIIL